MGMGLRFEQGRHCDNGICAVGRWDLVKIWAGKWEYRTPPSGPSKEALVSIPFATEERIS